MITLTDVAGLKASVSPPFSYRSHLHRSIVAAQQSDRHSIYPKAASPIFYPRLIFHRKTICTITGQHQFGARIFSTVNIHQIVVRFPGRQIQPGHRCGSCMTTGLSTENGEHFLLNIRKLCPPFHCLNLAPVRIM